MELPYVSIHRSDTNVFVAEFSGEGAEDAASGLIGRLIEAHPGVEYDLSVSDEQCGACKEVFWHEAPVHSNNGWHCPHCFAIVPIPDQEDN